MLIKTAHTPAHYSRWGGCMCARERGGSSNGDRIFEVSIVLTSCLLTVLPYLIYNFFLTTFRSSHRMNVFMRLSLTSSLRICPSKAPLCPWRRTLRFADLFPLATAWKSHLCLIIKTAFVMLRSHSVLMKPFPDCGSDTFSGSCLFACKFISLIIGGSFAVCCWSIITALKTSF